MISVIIPVYNTKPYLGKCINSVRRQSNRNWECIIVDDGSFDGSTDMCFDLTRGDSRFTVVALSRNRGLSNARNTGMEWARGEYLFFLDSDDWIEPNTLDCLYGEATVHPDAGRIMGLDVMHLDKGGAWGCSIEPAGMLKADSPYPFASRYCDLGHSTGCLYIRDNLPKLEFPKVPLFEDMILNMGLIFAGASTFVTRLYIYHYIRHEGSLLSRKLTKDDVDTLHSTLKGLADRYDADPKVYARFLAFLDNAISGRLSK